MSDDGDDDVDTSLDNSKVQEFKQFPLTKKEFESVVKNVIPGTKSVKKESMLIFPSKLCEVESETEIKTQIIFKNALVNEKPRTGADYFRADGYCQKCGRRKLPDENGELRLRCVVKYFFKIKEKPKANSNFVLVDYKIRGTHDHSKQTTQIRGEARNQLRQQILDSSNGSCKATYLKLMGEAGPDDFVPSEVTLRKIKSEKNNINNWEYLLRTAYKSLNVALCDKKLQGFIETVRTCPQLEIIYLLKEQIQAIQCLNVQERVLFVGVAEKIVHIPKKFFYNEELCYNDKILNYFCILKKLNFSIDGENNTKKNNHLEESMNSKRQLLVGELCTSQHDLLTLTNFFNTLQTSYSKYSERYDQLGFRLVVLDNFSWPLFQSIVSSVCCETILDYANRVYNLSKCIKTIDQFDNEKSWLYCSPQQTIQKFIFQLKQHINIDSSNKEIITQFCYYFYFLIKCRTLDQLLNIYESILIVCLSKTINNNYTASKQQLIKAFSDYLIESEKKEIDLALNEKDDENKNSKFELSELDKNFADFEESLCLKLQEKSRFIPEFNKIVDNVELKLLLEDNSSNLNQQYYPKFIEFINTKYMPFCFAWSSFSLINLNPINSVNKFLNVSPLDMYFSMRDSTKLIEKNLLPHIYTNEILALTRGKAKEFLMAMQAKTPIQPSQSIKRLNNMSSANNDDNSFENTQVKMSRF